MAVETQDIQKIATTLSQLAQNYNELAQNWFDIFYNPEARDITVKFFDENGNLASYTLPNRAKDLKYILNGVGDPSLNDDLIDSAVGSLYLDTSTGDIYSKQATYWRRMMSMNEVYSQGHGNPNGYKSGNRGDMYTDLDTGYLYLKQTETGTEGWELSGAGGKANETDVQAMYQDLLGRITAVQNEINAGVVHLTGNAETIQSEKTFAKMVTFNNTASNAYALKVTAGLSSFSGKVTTNALQANGAVTCASTLGVTGATTLSGAVTVAGNTTVNGTLTANNTANFKNVCTFDKVIMGTAYRALSADIAEYYDADEELPAGTLVQFGGEKEITKAKDAVNAVISTNPAYILNGDNNMEHPSLIALTGRIPVRVKGPVKKFDYIVLSDEAGVGKVDNSKNPCYNLVGRALEENLEEGEKLVECVVKLEL